jgi:RHH-type rel operon transcriptional repressor/antitoxin RelB
VLALRLRPEIEQRLDALAKKTGRSKSYYAREAIMRQIEDIEDDYLARRRLARGGPRVSLESLEGEPPSPGALRAPTSPASGRGKEDYSLPIPYCAALQP